MRRWLVLLAVACAPTGEEVSLDPQPEQTPVEPTPTPTPTPAGFVPDTDDTAVDVFVRLVEPLVLHPVGEEMFLRGRVQSTFGLDELTVSFTSDQDGAVGSPTLQEDGRFEWSTAGLSAGEHQITLTATTPDGEEASDTQPVLVCEWPPMETFDQNVVGNGWQTYGDATWDPGGWLEITGNVTSRRGSIYRTANKVNPGDFKIEFSIATGGGIGSGADGFSVNVVNVTDVPALDAFVADAGHGGCLGYGVTSGCGGTTTVDAFHVEIDTWHNRESFIVDPTSDNHIAINLDGDPMGHPLWVAVPGLEDLVWRDIVVQGVSRRLTLDIDGVRVIDSVLPNFSFDGGYIGVSGSTGAATNFHRFDNLRVYDRCIVPGATP